ncbi:repressor [Xanthomonas phaseoli pv. syngonii LMG 9055]|uniref:Repressor n=1 Tax=Xanthomonas phaseoli pv. syngonii LMG 9055 TaxID=1437878 RepID=A0A1V9HL95_9XANT|nr:repressor [Xanthomonas phaseoli pv. syngonii LMG 9055]
MPHVGTASQICGAPDAQIAGQQGPTPRLDVSQYA